MRKWLLFLPLLLFCSLFGAKPPELTPKDTRVKLEEILKAHASHHELTPELITRAFSNYLDLLDPIKTYLVENEVLKWKSPEPELLKQTISEIKKENFKSFEELHGVILSAVARRGSIEKRIALSTLPRKIDPKEFKNLSWAKDEGQLENRVLRIRALQMESAEKLDTDVKEQFLKRLEKRRLSHEEELVSTSPKERAQLVLSLTLKSVSAALDSQTTYFTPSEASQFMIQVQQRLFGIGAKLRDDLNGFTLVRLIEDGPASTSGKLKVGDKIIAVAGQPVVGMDITEAVELIRGPKGTAVILTILREIGEGEQKIEEKLDIEIAREEVVLKESRLDIKHEPYGDGTIGILHLFSFYQDGNSSSASDLTKAIETLKTTHHLKGIILDLRDNAGGLLPQAVAVTGLFIKKGIVVSVKDNTGFLQHLRNIEGTPIWDGPLLVLTNRTSASAAEIVAQTLQDYGRTLVVGDERTYGKGTFQTFTLEAAHFGKVNPKGEFKVTRGYYYTVSGKSPQLTGVKADIVVPGIYSHLDIGEKFAKFPLETDQIASNFEDTLADVPMMHRAQISRLYKFNLQPILNTLDPYVENLKKNSGERLEQSKNYKNFLKQLSDKEAEEEAFEPFGQSDLQLIEGCNIMKDLIFFMRESQPIAAGQ